MSEWKVDVSVQGVQRDAEASETPLEDNRKEGSGSNPSNHPSRLSDSLRDGPGSLPAEASTGPTREGEWSGGAPASSPPQGDCGAEMGLKCPKSEVSERENGKSGGMDGGGLDESTRLLMKQLTCPLTKVCNLPSSVFLLHIQTKFTDKLRQLRQM